ncbi:hypothetical protein TrVGV298_003171 [Trichoderma virens]|nr:hypothetical protein TrVGV298_003171 [Trichoderma virens]
MLKAIYDKQSLPLAYIALVQEKFNTTCVSDMSAGYYKIYPDIVEEKKKWDAWAVSDAQTSEEGVETTSEEGVETTSEEGVETTTDKPRSTTQTPKKRKQDDQRKSTAEEQRQEFIGKHPVAIARCWLDVMGAG